MASGLGARTPSLAPYIHLRPDSVWPLLPSPPGAATGPPLVPFTLNFTITNLPYMEDMWPPGSLKFSTMEKSLQHLVRAPPTSHCPPISARPAHCA